MDMLVRILYELTSALLIPVVVLLLGLLAWSLVEAGGFLREWLGRKRRVGAWRASLRRPAGPDAAVARSAFFERQDLPGLVAAFARLGGPRRDDRRELERLVDEIEIRASARCARMNLWIRLGPMLGLMGTLIPMGPALIGLSSGNMEALAGNLVVAFSTTVVGLIVGALFSVMSVARRHWYAQDIADLDHLLETVLFSDGGVARA